MAEEETCFSQNSSTGNEVWHLNILHETHAGLLQWGQASSPLVTQDLVYVQDEQGGAIAVAAEEASGKVRWTSEANGHGGYAAPIIAEAGAGQQLIVFAGEALFGVRPQTGKTLWQEPWPTSYGVNAATPLFDGQHLFVTSDYGRGYHDACPFGGGAKKEWQSKTVKT